MPAKETFRVFQVVTHPPSNELVGTRMEALFTYRTTNLLNTRRLPRLYYKMLKMVLAAVLSPS